MSAAKPILPASTEIESYMDELRHPFKKQIAELRSVILSAEKSIEERVKWRAPSYHVAGLDFLTFNPRDTSLVHLIFHHPAIEKIDSPILEGKLKGRRMVYFRNDADIRKKKTELQTVIRKLLTLIK